MPARQFMFMLFPSYLLCRVAQHRTQRVAHLIGNLVSTFNWSIIFASLFDLGFIYWMNGETEKSLKRTSSTSDRLFIKLIKTFQASMVDRPRSNFKKLTVLTSLDRWDHAGCTEWPEGDLYYPVDSKLLAMTSLSTYMHMLTASSFWGAWCVQGELLKRRFGFVFVLSNHMFCRATLHF